MEGTRPFEVARTSYLLLTGEFLGKQDLSDEALSDIAAAIAGARAGADGLDFVALDALKRACRAILDRDWPLAEDEMRTAGPALNYALAAAGEVPVVVSYFQRRRSLRETIQFPGRGMLVGATLLLILPLFWPLGLYVWIRWLTGHRADGDLPVRTLLRPAGMEQARAQALTAAASHPYKQCPMCAEDVRFEARICRFCGHSFVRELADPERRHGS